MHATTFLKAAATLAVLTPALSTHAEVIVTERLSRLDHTVFAGSGPVTDQYDVSFEETDLIAPFGGTQTYSAYVLNLDLAIPGEGEAEGTVVRDDVFTVEGGGLVQLHSESDIVGDATHFWGGGIGQVSTQNEFVVTFTVSEPTDLVLEGVMNPTADEYAEIRLQKSGMLFPRFQFMSLAGDSGPYLYTDTLEAGEYTIKAVMSLYILRDAQSDPPSSSEAADYTMTMTFGDGPTPCPADLDGDGAVGLADLLGVLAAWGDCPGCAADLDGDGLVGFADLLAILEQWGEC